MCVILSLPGSNCKFTMANCVNICLRECKHPETEEIPNPGKEIKELHRNIYKYEVLKYL